ncbi:MAG TPA: hypothetical protein VI136_06325 [Verrucomicrobiae bacterium]
MIRNSQRLAAGLMGLMAAGFTLISHAQVPNFIVDQLDTDTSLNFGNLGWGTAYPVIVWDGAVNKTTSLGPNTAGSGSAQWSVDWSATASGDQIMVTYRFSSAAVLNLVNYTNISFDIRFDPASATDGQGSFGAVEVDWTPQSDGWPSTQAGTAFFYATNTGWVHVEIPFDASTNPKLSAVTHVGFKIQQNRTGAALTGTTVFWMDNIILHGRAATVPPPFVALSRVTTPPGLMVVSPGGGNGYRRGMIRTLDPVYGTPLYSWVGQGDTPVTYSLTIGSYPAGYNAYQSQIFLVPNGGNDTSVDYNAATVLALDIRDQADGTATAALRYKTNHAYANASDYRPAVLVCSNGVVGTWTMTFRHDTNVTVTAPNGATTNFALPDAVPLEFSNPLTVYFGNQQNGAGNAGKAATYTRVQITGALSADIDDTFNRADLNPDPAQAQWRVVCDVPSCVLIVRPDHQWWANWTLPDTGFVLQASADLMGGPWVTDPQWTNVVNTTLGNRMPLPASSLPAPDQSFFRMVKTSP